jgi:DNA-binding response OmpR family regulator
VDVAGDGGRARAAGGGAFDLVVSDVLMPGLTGFELCRMIKADPALCEIPVVLVTTLREPQEIVQALEVGADSFIRKPYEPDVLVARLRSLLAQRPATRTSPHAPARRGRRRPAAWRPSSTARRSRPREPRADPAPAAGTFEDVVRANTLLREREEELSVAKRTSRRRRG